MEKAKRKNILLGFFVMVGITIFIYGIFQVGSKKSMFQKTFNISARFRNATGLKTGSNIRYNGVKVGIVKAVALINDTLVQVDMQIEENKRSFITRNAIASIASDGLMGDKIINITTSKSGGELIQNNDTIQAHNPLVTDQVFQTLNTTNENIKVISENLKELTTTFNTENGTIQSLYKDTTMANNLRQSFKNLNDVVGKVLVVSNNLEEITTQIQRGNGMAGKLINDTAIGKNLEYTLDNIKATSNQLHNVSDQLSNITQQVNSGKGTMGMLISDTAFAGNLQQSMSNINKASLKLDENMEALKHNFLTRGYFRKQAKKNKNK